MEWKVSSAVLYSWVMEQRTICLSGQPFDCIPRSYQCVSPANEKLAGLLLLATLKMDNFPALWRLLSTHGSSSIVFLVSTINCWRIKISGIKNGTWHSSSRGLTLVELSSIAADQNFSCSGVSDISSFKTFKRRFSSIHTWTNCTIWFSQWTTKANTVERDLIWNSAILAGPQTEGFVKKMAIIE